MKRVRYPAEFKAEAVKQVTERVYRAFLRFKLPWEMVRGALGAMTLRLQ